MAWEVSMVDLHETNNPERKPQIDTVGWLFLAFAIAITAAAAIVAYQANDTMVIGYAAKASLSAIRLKNSTGARAAIPSAIAPAALSRSPRSATLHPLSTAWPKTSDPAPPRNRNSRASARCCPSRVGGADVLY